MASWKRYVQRESGKPVPAQNPRGASGSNLPRLDNNCHCVPKRKLLTPRLRSELGDRTNAEFHNCAWARGFGRCGQDVTKPEVNLHAKRPTAFHEDWHVWTGSWLAEEKTSWNVA